MRNLLTYGLLLFVATAAAQSFKGNLKIENITFPEGHQLAYVYDITQDTTGRVWMRSSANFYTYDGHQLSKAEQEELGFSLPGVRRLYGGKLQPYFYIIRDSLIVFDPATKEVIRLIDYIPKNLGSFPKPQVVDQLSIGEDGVLWGLVYGENFENALVVRCDHSEAFRIVDTIDLSWYYGATLLRGTHFFVKKRDRVEEFDSSGKLRSYQFPSGADPVMPSMVKDDDNTIWVLHSSDKSKDQYRAYYLKEGQQEFIRLPQNKRFPQEEKPGQLFADGKFIWHWSQPFSLSRMRISDGTFEDFTSEIIEQKAHFPFYNSTLLNIFRDRSGEIWLTTRAGMVKMTIEEDLFRVYELAEIKPDCYNEECHIRGITEDEAGNIYLSYQHGIAKLNPKTGDLSLLPLNIPAQAQKVQALTYARGTLFWNEYAIDLKTFNSKKFFSPSTYTYLVHGTDPGQNYLWVGVNDLPLELYKYDIQRKELATIHFPDTILDDLNNEIRQIHFSPTTSTLLLSVWGEGVLEIGLNNKVQKIYHSYPMYGLYEDDAAQLWIGQGQESGLSKMDLNTKEVTEYPYIINSFTGSIKRAFQILPGKEGFLWLVTERGTMRLDIENGELSRFPMFPTLSDMAFHLLPGYAAKEGTLYIGTPDGRLNAFHPEVLYKKAGFDQQYPLAINRFERFNQKQDTLITQLDKLVHLSEIYLTHQDRYFNLEFFVPDFRNSGLILYSHWLEGYDKEWSTPSQINQLRYENLPSGEYALHIRGGLTPDYYASSERVIKVIVYPAWYTTWWAYSLFGLLISSLLYLFYRYQVSQQLEKAEAQRLRELNTLKSRLYTNITHEFRTPLTVIMGMTDNIKGHSDEKMLIQRNSENLLRLINQLLDLSKLDAGLLKIDSIQADIIPYLQYLTESFYSLAKEKQVQLTFYPEVKKLVMDFDEAKIQHIIYNLLSNALKFTPEEGKVILHLRQLEIKGQSCLQIKVSDTGVGIAEEELPHVFDRFYQAPSGRGGAEAGGTGVGLALTKELVELMGGQIVVESELGTGTDFMLLLPVRQAADTPQLEQSVKNKARAEEGGANLIHTLGNPTSASEHTKIHPDTDRSTLLIIEDNRDVVAYIQTLLRKDYQIETATNGHEGIEKAMAIIPDIIISDVMMPVKNGYEVCETLKNDERTSHIPIILLTAKATTEDRIEGLKGGADAYLTKPFHKKELFVRLEKLIELRKALQARYGSPDLFSKQILPEKEPSLEDRFLQKLIKVVRDRLNDPDLAVIHLCRAAHLSNTQVNRKLKALTGKTPSQFIRSIRLQKALELLQTTDLNISEIAYDVGFNDPNYFSRSFSEEFGHPPNAVRK